MKRIALIASVTALVLAAPAAAQAATHFEGTVVSVNRDNRTFRLHDSERGTIRIKVTRNTSCAGRRRLEINGVLPLQTNRGKTCRLVVT